VSRVLREQISHTVPAETWHSTRMSANALSRSKECSKPAKWCKEVRAMRYLRIMLLVLAVTFGTQACILFVPVGGGGGGHHHGGR
jgi:hypothetical protein